MGWTPRALHNLQAKGIVSLVEFRSAEHGPRITGKRSLGAQVFQARLPDVV